MLRLGAIPFLNARPLLWGLRQDPEVTLLEDLPSRLTRRLLSADVQAAIVPVIECLRSGLSIFPGIGIGSTGAVRSVLLFLGRPLAEVKRVALDASSRTSAALAQVLLAGWGKRCQYIEHPPRLPEMPGRVDAALLIGDPALREAQHQQAGGHPVPYLDLGEQWTRETGLPFVYAVWAGAPDCDWSELGPRLQASLRSGLGRLEEISHAEAKRLDLPYEICLDYLTRRIQYRVTERHLAGLQDFGRRCRRLGLVGEHWEPKLWQG